MIDFYLSPTRNTKAAKRLLAKMLKGLEHPRVSNSDKAPTYGAARAELMQEGKCASDVRHRQAKYMTKVVEADHGRLKQLIKPVRGFKTMKTAYATSKGFEVMRALRKGQSRSFNLIGDINGEVRMIKRSFGLGPCGLAEAMSMLELRLAS